MFLLGCEIYLCHKDIIVNGFLISIYLFAGKRLFFGGGDSSDMSPMSRPRRSRYTNTPELVQTPANRGEDDHGDSDEDIVLAPKSLAATFDYFSDSD